jgi:O-antigen/teichoic acid export membrane protein
VKNFIRVGSGGFARDASLTMSANGITLVVSSISIVLLPKWLTAEGFGYLQLYLLIASFAGVLHLGWADGVYLALGGKSRAVLRSGSLWSDFVGYTCFQVVLLLGLAPAILFTAEGSTRFFVWAAGLLSMLLANIRVYGYMAQQAVGAIKGFVFAVVVDRVVFIVLALFLVGVGNRDFRAFVVADLIARFCSCVLTVVLMFGDRIRVHVTLFQIRAEARTLVNLGFPLMVANFVGLFILGSTRFMFDATLGIERFGSLSLALSLASLVAVFAAAASIPLFPRLRRLASERLAKSYVSMRCRLGQFLLLVTLAYPVVSRAFTAWFPNYTDGAVFLSILFPVLLYETEVGVLFSTFLKTVGGQRSLLSANAIALCVSLVLGSVTLLYFGSPSLAALVMLISAGVRARAAEAFLVRRLSLSGQVWFRLEDACLALFVLANAFLNGRMWSLAWVAATLASVVLMGQKAGLLRA